jgi:hypothetical protein
MPVGRKIGGATHALISSEGGDIWIENRSGARITVISVDGTYTRYVTKGSKWVLSHGDQIDIEGFQFTFDLGRLLSQSSNGAGHAARRGVPPPVARDVAGMLDSMNQLYALAANTVEARMGDQAAGGYTLHQRVPFEFWGRTYYAARHIRLPDGMNPASVRPNEIPPGSTFYTQVYQAEHGGFQSSDLARVGMRHEGRTVYVNYSGEIWSEPEGGVVIGRCMKDRANGSFTVQMDGS